MKPNRSSIEHRRRRQRNNTFTRHHLLPSGKRMSVETATTELNNIVDKMPERPAGTRRSFAAFYNYIFTNHRDVCLSLSLRRLKGIYSQKCIDAAQVRQRQHRDGANSKEEDALIVVDILVSEHEYISAGLSYHHTLAYNFLVCGMAAMVSKWCHGCGPEALLKGASEETSSIWSCLESSALMQPFTPIVGELKTREEAADVADFIQRVVTHFWANYTGNSAPIQPDTYIKSIHMLINKAQ